MRAAGRTDAGVHAKQQYVSIEVPTIVDPSKLQAGVNALTPTTLQCFSLSTCDTAFDPRRSAHRKCYAYRIFNNRTPSVFKQANSLFVPQPLDFLAMRDAAAYLTGTKDWSSFRASDCGASTATRTIESSHIFRDSEGVLQFRIVGCGFLKQMVRILAGTLVEVGQGKRAAASIPELIELRDRSLAGQTA
ncbi:UNVERIFIED_CONTAM: hypothetical protein GTU68_038009, partial [Idotea baltica]|nr:hypothetical protein [Idotea baltica]